MEMQIYTSSGGPPQGPFTVDQINQQLLAGVSNCSSTMAWYEGCGNWIPLAQVPGVVPDVLGAPPPPPPPSLPPLPPQGDVFGGMIPYQNSHALTAYYLGVFGLIPLLGLVLAIPAIVLGRSGLKKQQMNPTIKGSSHAWAGIILGWISVACHLLGIVLIIFTNKK